METIAEAIARLQAETASMSAEELSARDMKRATAYTARVAASRAAEDAAFAAQQASRAAADAAEAARQEARRVARQAERAAQWVAMGLRMKPYVPTKPAVRR